MICAVEGCGRQVKKHARWCPGHEQRVTRRGNPLAVACAPCVRMGRPVRLRGAIFLDPDLGVRLCPRHRARPCEREGCGLTIPLGKRDGTRFCSTSCQRRALHVERRADHVLLRYGSPDAECLRCGRWFTPVRRKAAAFCQDKCRSAFNHEEKREDRNRRRRERHAAEHGRINARRRVRYAERRAKAKEAA